MEQPLVSVIITNYNSGNFLFNCIESIKSQTYKNLEIIVIDDCSKDFSIDFLKNDPSIIFDKTEQNSGGPAIPRNIGIRIAKGDFIAFVDADDVWHEKKIEFQTKILINNKLDFCSSSKLIFNCEQPKFRDLSFADLDTVKIKRDKLLYGNDINLSSVLVSKKLLEGNFFNEKKEYQAVEDYDLWLKTHLEIDYSIKIKHELIGYRSHSNNLSSNKLAQLAKFNRVLINNINYAEFLKYPIFLFWYLFSRVKRYYF